MKLIDNVDEIKQIYKDENIVKLFYSNHHKMECHSNNWGLAKGENKYQDVCIVATDKIKSCISKGNFSKIPPTTLKKFYVACSRANRNLYFVDRKLISKLK